MSIKTPFDNFPPASELEDFWVREHLRTGAVWLSCCLHAIAPDLTTGRSIPIGQNPEDLASAEAWVQQDRRRLNRLIDNGLDLLQAYALRYGHVHGDSIIFHHALALLPQLEKRLMQNRRPDQWPQGI